MKRSFIYLMIAAALSVFAACTPNNNGGDKSDDLAVNTYSVDGVVRELKSVAVDMQDENLYVVATPKANITSAEAILECEERVFAAVNPLLVGKEFDLKTEQSLFTIISTLSGAELETVTPSTTEEIVAGKAIIRYTNGVAFVQADITLVNGVNLKFVLSATAHVEVNENTISRGSENKPIRASIYDEQTNKTTLYFTPAGIEHAGELNIASWYLYITVANNLIDGEKHSITSLEGNSMFEFGVIDNLSDSKSVEIMADYLRGATGDFEIEKIGDAKYSAEINIKVLGVQYTVHFNGNCISYDYEPEKKINYLLYDDAEYTISAATITKGAEFWSVEFATSSGNNITLTAPENFFEGVAKGFSQSAYFAVTYDGHTYSKASGSSGTLTALFNSEEQSLTADFTNYDNLEFNYTGGVEVK